MAEYPLPKFHFEVQWGGTKIGFTEVTGLEVTTEKIEYRDGASKEYHKIRMPGMQTFGDLTLKRGVFAGDNEFYDWWNTVALNTIERRDITISLLNESARAGRGVEGQERLADEGHVDRSERLRQRDRHRNPGAHARGPDHGERVRHGSRLPASRLSFSGGLRAAATVPE